MNRGKNELRQMELFRGIRPDTLDRLWQAGKVERCKKGQVIMRAREEVTSIYIQLTGKSMIYNLTHHGGRKIIFIYGKGSLLNEHVLNEHPGSVFCETIEESRIFVVPVPEFTGCMEADFVLAKAVIAAQERKLWRLSHQLKNTMGNIYMERKLAAKLWKLSRDFGVQVPEGIEIDINLSITFLADMLGAPRETTSRLCKTLTDYGLMKMNRKRITIINPEKMSIFYKTGRIGEDQK